MTGAELKKGISMLYDMETNHYLMARAIQQLDREASRLAVKRGFGRAKRKECSYSIIDFLIFLGAAGVIIGGIIGIIWQWNLTSGFFDKILGVFAGGIVGILAGGGIGLGAGVVCYIVYLIIAGKQIEDAYEAECTEVRNLEIADERCKRELVQKRHLLRQRDILQERLNKSKAIAATMYTKMGIDREYRHIIAVGYMNEFLRLGISDKLGGADGLYYLVRKEIQWDALQSSLLDIAEKLDTLVDRQRDLHRDLLQMNQKCDRMIDQTVKTLKRADAIADNTYITAYNTERIHRELEFQNFMLLLS